MRWRPFLLWNALGGISWATSVSLAAYFGGKAVEHVVADIGLYGLIAAAVLIALAAVVLIRRQRTARRARKADAPPPNA
jgi:membrane protein DedA with SNARE-associated domain